MWNPCCMFSTILDTLHVLIHLIITTFSLLAQMVKNPPVIWETWVRSLGWEDPLEKGTAIHSNFLDSRIPWTTKSWT